MTIDNKNVFTNIGNVGTFENQCLNLGHLGLRLEQACQNLRGFVAFEGWFEGKCMLLWVHSI